MTKPRVAVVGASGYSGIELLHLLLRHDGVDITLLTSRQYAEQRLCDVFPGLDDVDMCFKHPDVDEIKANADIAFLALPHGVAEEYAAPLYNAGLKVVDISADFRLSDPDLYARVYERQHTAPELLSKAVYGLPELSRHELNRAGLIACPGCYPTGAILPLAPLLKRKLIKTARICISSMSGVTGAGRKAKIPLLFGECNESIRPYSVGGHRHAPEIEEQLCVAAGEEVSLSFVPHLIPVSRGIITTIHAEVNENVTDPNVCSQALAEAYHGEPFIRVLSEGAYPDTKNVQKTNVCEISCSYHPQTHQVILNSAIDNLTKGAAGQAVQAMNLLLGLPEKTGLT